MPPTPLDAILAPYQSRRREALLPVLWEVQTAFGHINAEAVRSISHTLRVPEADIYGVISFYSLFHDAPTGETLLYLCTDPICGLAGADALFDATCARLGLDHGPDPAPDRCETTRDGRFSVLHTTCLGLCEHAPAALVCQRSAEGLSLAPVRSVDDLLTAQAATPRVTFLGGDQRVLLPATPAANPAQPESLAAYGDYAALRRVVTQMTPDSLSAAIETIGEVDASGLIGRGGAAFSTGLKWKLTRQAVGQPKYVVCNADESEPGTFKDRVMMEARPHLLLEGMAICGYAVGAERGYLFIRGEYPEATRILSAALDEARAAGLLGARLFGSAFSFDIEIRRGAGAYICGEETALFEAIEGKRGFPRIKPPFPTAHGLFGKPTVVNNVETLGAVVGIVQHGAAWFRQVGTDKSTGTKLFCVSGHVRQPGVYEIAPGMTLRALLDQHCGGVVGDLGAVLMGGASGTFLAPSEIDVPLTFEGLRHIGGTLGTGAVMVFNTTVDLRDVLRRVGRFFQHESCGKCFPCQLGTQRQRELLDRLDAPLVADHQRLLDVGLTMTDASLCGLGQTAAAAVLSALKRWPALFAPEGA